MNGTVFAFPPASLGRATRNSREAYLYSETVFKKTLQRLFDKKIQVYVDSIHRGNDEWFRETFKSRHQFFDCSGQTCDYKRGDFCFLVCFNDNASLEPHHWVELTAFMADHDYNDEIIKQLFCPDIPEPIKKSEPTLIEIPPSKNFYDLDLYHIPNLDIMICSVIKPSVDRPYTLVLRNYSKVGMRPLFTGLFIDSSWGVCNADVGFLFKVWKHFKFPPEEFDINEMMRVAVEKCTPKIIDDPEIGEYAELASLEPELYREDIEKVISRVKTKSENCGVVTLE